MNAIKKFTTYRVTGNTYAFRGELKSIGGRWNKPDQSWIVEVGGMKSVGNAKFILERAQKGGCIVEEI